MKNWLVIVGAYQDETTWNPHILHEKRGFVVSAETEKEAVENAETAAEKFWEFDGFMEFCYLHAPSGELLESGEEYWLNGEIFRAP